MNADLAKPDDVGLEYDESQFLFSSGTPQGPVRGELFEMPEVKYLSEVPYRPLEWLWDGRIPSNKVTLIEGPAESGKSLLAMDLAVRASRDMPMPGEARATLQGDLVALVSQHDDLHDTVLPRIKRAGGDIEKFIQISEISQSIGDTDPSAFRKLRLPADFPHLIDAVSSIDTRLIVVDPLACFCRSSRDFLESLELLDDLASRLSLPIIVTLSAKTALHRDGVCVTRPAMSDEPARCVWSIVVDPEDARRRLFLPTRMTFGTPREGMAFRIVNGRIAWEPLPAPALYEHDESVAWLLSVLQEGEQRVRDVHRQAAECGITPKMLRRAREVLGVKIRREGFREKGVYFWSLPPIANLEGTTLSTVRLAPPQTAARLTVAESGAGQR